MIYEDFCWTGLVMSWRSICSNWMSFSPQELRTYAIQKQFGLVFGESCLCAWVMCVKSSVYRLWKNMIQELYVLDCISAKFVSNGMAGSKKSSVIFFVFCCVCRIFCCIYVVVGFGNNDFCRIWEVACCVCIRWLVVDRMWSVMRWIFSVVCIKWSVVEVRSSVASPRWSATCWLIWISNGVCRSLDYIKIFIL